MTNHRKRIVSHVAIIVIAFAAGLCAGVIFYPNLMGGNTVAQDDHGHDHGEVVADPHEGEEIVALTQAAVDNIRLETGTVALGDYTKQLTIPGEVVEIPGQSDLSVSSPISGIVESVAIRAGESVGQGDQLFTIRITDPNLIAAQSELLSTIAQITNANVEIQRLTPLAAEGAVSSKRKRELEYQVQQLDVERQVKMQEIRARGLPQHTLANVLETRQLADRIKVSVPQFDVGLDPTPADFSIPVGLNGTRRLIFSVTSLQTHPGMTVSSGDPLCHFAYHGRLYVKGEAFEIDLDPISRVASEGRNVAAEFGHQHQDGHQHSVRREDLNILHIENHVDPETQTFAFYIPLQNDVVQDLGDGDRVFRQWRFKPGQRAHIRIPMEQWQSQLKLPLSAVAIEGPNAVVFRKHVHDHGESLGAGIGAGVGAGIGDLGVDDHAGHDHDDAGHDHEDHAGHDHDGADHAGHDHADNSVAGEDHSGHDHAGDDHAGHAHGDEFAIELEPVPVHVIHRDDQTVIIDPNGELHLGDEVALNNAYKLQLMLKMNAGGGGGAHHGHDH